MDRVSIAISRVSMFLIVLIVAIMFYEVVMRYVFASPTLWVNEMSLWAAGAVYLLAGLYVMQQRGQIRILLLYDAVPRNWQRAFAVVSTLLLCLFSAAVVCGCCTEARDNLPRTGTCSPTWSRPLPPPLKPPTP